MAMDDFVGQSIKAFYCRDMMMMMFTTICQSVIFSLHLDMYNIHISEPFHLSRPLHRGRKAWISFVT